MRPALELRDLPSGLPARYCVSHLLGQGSRKRVYLAHDLERERPVAIALVVRHPGEATTLDEARALAQLGERPHIVPILDWIETEAALWIVSPYFAGGDLAARLQAAGGPLPLSRVVRIGAQLCAALECAHVGGILHRDVKPANVMLDERGDAFLGDFGLASFNAGAREDAAVGTPAYIAPELLAGRCDPRADLYSLGCTLHELATGRPPFVAKSSDEIFRLHQLTRPGPPSSWNPSVSAVFDDLVLALLEKDPERRPAAARDVRCALEGIGAAGLVETASTARGVAAPRRRAGESALVGRSAELARLDAVLVRLARSQPSVALVRGEPGIGKSELLREFRARAEAIGARVLVGRAYEDEQSPYHVFVSALRPLAAQLGRLDAADAVRLRSFLRLDDAPACTDVETAGEDRRPLFVSLVRALFAIARSAPVVLLFDDLHWADSASLALLDHLVSALLASPERGNGFAIVAGTRGPDDAGRNARALSRLGREPGCEKLDLAGLGEGAVHLMLESLGLARPTSVLVRRVCEISGGNPLFVRELVAHLERTGGVRRLRGSALAAAELAALALPESLSQAIAGRTGQLAPLARDLLAFAAVLGERFELDALAAIAGRPRDEVSSALDEAVQRGALVTDGYTYHFAHSLVRQVVYQRAGASWVQRTHLDVARRLQRSSAPSGEAELQIAHHLIRSGALASADEVARHAAIAGDRALANCAFGEAIELLEVALSAPTELGAHERAELHRKIGHAYFQTFDTGPCLDHLNKAIVGHRQSGDAIGLALASNDLVRATAQFGHVPYGALGDVAPLEAALARIDPEERALRARLTGTLAEAYWFAMQPDRAVTLASEALALAQSVGDHQLCSEICRALALAHLQGLRIEAAAESWRAGARHARRADDLFGVSQCLVRLPIALIAMGRLDEAEQSLREALELHRVVPHRGDGSLALAHHVAIAAARGQLDLAEGHADRVIELVRRVKFSFAGQVALPALAYARSMRGDVRGAHAAIDLLVTPGVVEDDPKGLQQSEPQHRALIDAYAGEPVDPRSVPRLPVLSREGFDYALLGYLCAAIELADAADLREIAPDLCAAIELAAERGIVFAAGWPFFVPRLRGLAAALAGDLDAADARFAESAEAAQRLGAAPEIARTRVDHARLLLVRGAPGDRERAAALLAAALPGLREYGPRVALERAERLAAFAVRNP